MPIQNLSRRVPFEPAPMPPASGRAVHAIGADEQVFHVANPVGTLQARLSEELLRGFYGKRTPRRWLLHRTATIRAGATLAGVSGIGIVVALFLA